ncbi:hypothetical protein L596_024899 [Steinernema carpocapsae]|uniref:Uncharacterized protein n=1 Tax=Steinernema carpocapsae TaxID=34508 RepID=A0A4V5ZYM9_STECR|nr:hypothetical protein L596_024899 [Steinernema carpocapsae]
MVEKTQMDAAKSTLTAVQPVAKAPTSQVAAPTSQVTQAGSVSTLTAAPRSSVAEKPTPTSLGAVVGSMAPTSQVTQVAPAAPTSQITQIVAVEQPTQVGAVSAAVAAPEADEPEQYEESQEPEAGQESEKAQEPKAEKPKKTQDAQASAGSSEAAGFHVEVASTPPPKPIEYRPKLFKTVDNGDGTVRLVEVLPGYEQKLMKEEWIQCLAAGFVPVAAFIICVSFMGSFISYWDGWEVQNLH